MRKFIFTTLFCLFLAHLQAADFSFFVFSSEWAGSVCESNNCNDDKGVSDTFWNIHGLWPSDGTINPNYCTEEKFDPSQLKNISDKLNKYWSGLYASQNTFHSHEWTKHGTCSRMTQNQYFSTVIKLAETLDIYSTLAKHGITPGASYDCNKITSVIKQEYGVEAFNVTLTGGNLSSIEMCVDLKLNPVDCPESTTPTACHGNAKYPDFKKSVIIINE